MAIIRRGVLPLGLLSHTCDEMVKENCRLAMPTLLNPALDPTESEGLIGYPVHSRCWELLSHHRALGSIAKTDLGTTLHVLRRKYEEWGYGTEKSEVDDIPISQGGKINSPCRLIRDNTNIDVY